MPDKRSYDPAALTARFLAAHRTRPLPDRLAPGAALLAVDLVGYFLAPESPASVPAAAAALARSRALVGGFRRAGLPVLFTRHVDRDGSPMVRWWGRAVSTPAHTALAIETAPGEAVFDKAGYDAFDGTLLAPALEGHRTTSLVVCGLLTHLCCETTARAAFGRGFDVVFASDATATHHEGFHEGTLHALAHGFARIAAVPQILERL